MNRSFSAHSKGMRSFSEQEIFTSNFKRCLVDSIPLYIQQVKAGLLHCPCTDVGSVFGRDNERQNVCLYNFAVMTSSFRQNHQPS